MTTDKHFRTRFIHWLSALIVIGIVVSGIFMSNSHDYSIYPWHKSFGVIALALIIIRLYQRSKQRWVSSAAGSSQERFVHVIHQILIVCLIAMPLSGLGLSGFGGYGVDVFGLTFIPSNYVADEAVAYSQALSDVSKQIHIYVGYSFASLIVLHAGAAFKHHFIEKDKTLLRMISAKHNQAA
jgi:cytochrome b561